MQWLYNILHGLFTIMFAWYGKIWWLIKKSVLFQITVITTIISVGVILWRMFYFGITKIIESMASIQMALGSVSSITSVGDILDLANFLFPVEECFAMLSILISYGVVCLTIRIIRSFIPTMT